MRNLAKQPEPTILSNNHSNWLSEFKADSTNTTKKYRYRHIDIKSVLKKETSNKCVYCESKVGHNTPGDIEHKLPSSKCIDEHFAWGNLTIACTECNRRKNDYYDEGDSFIDPYIDDVESLLEHHGPVVLWKTGDSRIEISIRTLELHNYGRPHLIGKKIEKIEDFNELIERYTKENEPMLKKVLKNKIKSMADSNAEYSAMIKSVLSYKDINLNA